MQLRLRFLELVPFQNNKPSVDTSPKIDHHNAYTYGRDCYSHFVLSGSVDEALHQ